MMPAGRPSEYSEEELRISHEASLNQAAAIMSSEYDALVADILMTTAKRLGISNGSA